MERGRLPHVCLACPCYAAQELLCVLIQGLSCPSLSTSSPPFLLSVPPVFNGNCLSCSPSETNHVCVKSADEFLSGIIFDPVLCSIPEAAVMQALVSLSGPVSPVAQQLSPCTPESPWLPLSL